MIFNVGSSSCKFQIFTEDLTLLGKGLVEKIGIPGSNIEYKTAEGQEFTLEKDITFDELDKFMISYLEDNNLID